MSEVRVSFIDYVSYPERSTFRILRNGLEHLTSCTFLGGRKVIYVKDSVEEQNPSGWRKVVDLIKWLCVFPLLLLPFLGISRYFLEERPVVVEEEGFSKVASAVPLLSVFVEEESRESEDVKVKKSRTVWKRTDRNTPNKPKRLSSFDDEPDWNALFEVVKLDG